MKNLIIDAVSKAGYRECLTDDGDHITVSVIDSEADEALAAIRKHLPEGATADFAGSSNTDAEGDTTEDIRIEWETEAARDDRQEMSVTLTNGDVIEAYKDVTGTYASKWQIGQKTGSCYQRGDEVTDEIEARA